MLTITSRALREVTFDPAGNLFLGRVEVAFRHAPDEPRHEARLLVRLALSHRSRFHQIETALLDEAERQLRQRLAQHDEGPKNIFAPRVHVVVAPARKAA
ncbi:MAG: hypothetical protein RIR62_1753 [Pseudomonadota bacterium]